MSLKRNILVNYASQIYITLIGVIVVPLYLRYMGIEAYGLIGFFSMLQVWFGLLDMGLTLTVARETARFRGGNSDVLTYRRLLRSLQIVFILVGVVIGGLTFINAGDLAVGWLTVNQMKMSEVEIAIQLMAVTIALRWVAGLYRGSISGHEAFAWLSAFNVTIASVRFIGVLPILILTEGDTTKFFCYQVFVAIMELLFLTIKATDLMPVLPNDIQLGWSYSSLVTAVRPSLIFSLKISFAAFLWVVMTQVDKLMLSKLLSLADYGVYSLAVLASSGVVIVSSPMSNALLPRMTKVFSQGNHNELMGLYRRATQVLVVIVAPISLSMAVFSGKILYAWTGDYSISDKASATFAFYALGNGLMALSAFPYYLQYAKGKLKFHLIGSVLFLTFFIPCLYSLTNTYGMVGAAFAWFFSNILYFILWPPLVHKYLAKGYHKRWLINDISGSVVISFLMLVSVSAVFDIFDIWPNGRLEIVFILFSISSGSVFFAMLTADYFRSRIKLWFRRRLGC